MAEIFHECRSAGRVFTQKEWGDYCDMTRHDETKKKRLIKMVEDYKRSIKPKFIQLELF